MNKIYKSHCKTNSAEKGSVITVLLSAVGISAALMMAVYGMLSGPLRTATLVAASDKSRSELGLNSKALVAASVTAPDGVILPPAFDPTGTNKPTNGGLIPAGLGVQNDPWGIRYGYCVWDHGPTNTSANRINGQTTLFDSNPVIVIVSAGPDKQFSSTCSSTVPYFTRSGDDLARVNSILDISSGGAGDYWLKDTADADTIRYGSPGGVLVGPSGTPLTGAEFQVAGQATFDGGVTVDNNLTAVGGINNTVVGDIDSRNAGFTSLNANSVTGITLTRNGGGTGAVSIGTLNVQPGTQAASTALVDELNAERLDGQNSAFYRNATNKTGIFPTSILPAYTGDAVAAVGTGNFTVERLMGQLIAGTAPVAGQMLVWSTMWQPGYPNMSGDITGNTNTTIVEYLRGRQVSSAAPAANQVLSHNGLIWEPRNIATSGGGNTIPTGGVNFLATAANITAGNCSAGQVPKYNGTAWNCDTDSAGSALTLPFNVAPATGQRIMTTASATAVYMGWKATSNIYIGEAAGASIDTPCCSSASGNVIMGAFASQAGSNIVSNVIIGVNAYRNSATSLGASVLVGNNTSLNKGTSTSTLIGHNVMADASATFSNQHVAIGSNALFSVTTSSSNTAVGSNAMYRATTSLFNTAIGHNAMYNLTTGAGGGRNVAIGFESMMGSSTGPGFYTGGTSVAIGSGTIRNASLVTGLVAIGRNALNSTTNSANGVTAVGQNAARNSANPSLNVAIGNNALLFNTTSNSITAIGHDAIRGAVGIASGDESTAIGHGALYSLQAATVANNTAIGHNALYANTTGTENIAIGVDVLESSTTSSQNIAIGHNVLNAYNAAGGSNIGVGRSALFQLQTNSQTNIAIGGFAMAAINEMSGSIGIGHSALYGVNAVNTGFSIGLGYGALGNLETGLDNIAAGNLALSGVITGNYNVGVGKYALFGLDDGNYNVGLGANTLANNTSGWGNVAVGYGALSLTLTSNYNIGIGKSALIANTGSNNIGIGSFSLVNASDTKNIAIGHYALNAKTTNPSGIGDIVVGNNAAFQLDPINTVIAIGHNALYDSTSMVASIIAIGTESAYSNTSGNNISIGTRTLYAAATGDNNIAIGRIAMENASSGSNANIAVGTATLNAAGTKNDNIAIGLNAQQGNTFGNRNIVIGNSALTNAAASFENIIIGHSAGTSAVGNRNVIIGNLAGNTLLTGSNNILIGYNINTPGPNTSNYLNIGNATNGSVFYGSMVTGNMTLKGTLTAPSDVRLKEEIQNIEHALDTVLKLRPVSYKWKPEYKKDTRTYVGFIAQDVLKILPEAVFETKNAVNADEKILTIAYEHMAPLLFEALKDQNRQIDNLEADIKALSQTMSMEAIRE